MCFTFFKGQNATTQNILETLHKLSPTIVKIKSLNPQNCNANIKSSLQRSFITIFPSRS